MKHFVSDIDRIMALIYEDQPLPPPVPKGTVSYPAPEPFVRKARAPLRREKKEPPKPQLKLDFSSLSKIRTDAELTMNKLITEEELEEEAVCGTEECSAASLPKEKPLLDASLKTEITDESLPSGYGLSALEAKLLLALIKGDNVSEIDTGGQMLSVLVDQINEKLFDEFADTVIENGTPPAPLPDYEEDLRAMFL